jgi:multisubunit Na+/H+ antiporter MnhB subunit
MIGRWTGWLGWGVIVSYLTYTLYHRLGKWNWRSVGGVGLAGLVFTILYLWQPEPRSLIAVIIVHGLATAGFLSWSDETLYQLWKRQQASGKVGKLSKKA